MALTRARKNGTVAHAAASLSSPDGLSAEIAGLRSLTLEELRARWLKLCGRPAPSALKSDLLARGLAQRLQVLAGGDRRNSEALLTGLLRDDRGHAMSPSYAAKGGARYRYYTSQAPLQGRRAEAGSVARVPAPEIEKAVLEPLSTSRCRRKRKAQRWA